MSRADKEARRKRKANALRAKRPALWKECREKFGLDDEDIRKAKEMGFLPERLIALPKRPAEKWKQEPRKWIRSEYEKYEERKLKKKRSKEKYERRRNEKKKVDDRSGADNCADNVNALCREQ